MRSPPMYLPGPPPPFQNRHSQDPAHPFLYATPRLRAPRLRPWLRPWRPFVIDGGRGPGPLASGRCLRRPPFQLFVISRGTLQCSRSRVLGFCVPQLRLNFLAWQCLNEARTRERLSEASVSSSSPVTRTPLHLSSDWDLTALLSLSGAGAGALSPTPPRRRRRRRRRFSVL